MQMPVQITFRHMASSPAIEERIRERVDALERFFRDHILPRHCRTKGAASARQRLSNPYRPERSRV